MHETEGDASNESDLDVFLSIADHTRRDVDISPELEIVKWLEHRCDTRKKLDIQVLSPLFLDYVTIGN